MKSELVAQSNELTLSKIHFNNVYEKRLLYSIVDSISPYLKDMLEADRNGKSIHAQYEKGLFEIDHIIYRAKDLEKNRQHYPNIRAAIRRLQEDSIVINKENGDEISTRLILKSVWKAREEFIRLTVDRDLYQFLKDLTKGYTLFHLKTALSLPSLYSMKMYEIIAKFRTRPMFYMDLERLRFLTNSEGIYKKTSDFKKWVLDVAQRDLEKSQITDLRFTYRHIKKGRTIVGFEFFIIKTENSFEKKKVMNSISPRWSLSKRVVQEIKDLKINLKGSNIETFRRFCDLYSGKDDVIIEKLRFYESVAETKVGYEKISGYVVACVKKEIDKEKLK